MERPVAARVPWRALILCFAIGGAPVGAPPAAELERLYEAEVPVLGKADEERKAALGAALLQVVIKVSGNRSPSTNSLVSRALEEPSRFVQQYRYRSADTGDAEGTSPQPLRLWARFDPEAVDTLLGEAGLPVWGRVRPTVLALVAIDTGAGRELLSSGDAAGWSVILSEEAELRGVPVVLPLMDLEDRRRLRVSDVWAGFEDSLRDASRRYQSKVILVGRVFRVVTDAWEARWSLLLEDGRHTWVDQAKRPDTLLRNAVHETADLLVSRFGGYASLTGTAGVELVVAGVRSLEDYARTLEYLDALDEVTSIQVTRVDSDRVVFNLEARGGRESVRQVVALGRTLVEQPQGEWGGGLRYRLLP